MSLANRPAWGATGKCFVSGFGSATQGGSGDPGDSSSCDYSSPSDVFNALEPNEYNKKIGTLFDCSPDPDPKIGDALMDGLEQWRQYMVTAALNPVNPLGSTSVEAVYCHFESGTSDPYNFGNVLLTKNEVLEFLTTVIPLPIWP